MKASIDFLSRTLEKHIDKRGTLFETYRRDIDGLEIRQVYFSTSKPEAIRGNHYHKRKSECFCVLSGKADLSLVDVESGLSEILHLSSEMPEFIIVHPGVAHALKCIGDDQMFLLVMTTEEYNPEDPDTFSMKIL